MAVDRPEQVDAAPRDRVEAQLEALASATRRAVYRELLATGRAVAVDEVARSQDITANMARRHLDTLAAAGLVEESVEERRTRGRPRRLYLGRRDALAGWGADGAFVTLAALLAEVHRDDADPYEVGYRFAAAPDGEPDDGGVGPADRLWLSLLVAGFEPCVPEGVADTVVLRACPVAAAAEVDPHTVCALHRGLIDGVLGAEVQGVRLVPRPPREAGCLIRLPDGRLADATLAKGCD